MGISDDIKIKKKSQKEINKHVDEIKNPNEIDIKFNNEQKKDHEEDFFYQDDLNLDQKEEDFFQDDHNSKPLEKNRKKEYQQIREVEKTHGNPMTKWVIMLILILIGLLVWQNYSKISKLIGFNKNADTSSETDLPSYDLNSTGTDYTSQQNQNTSTTNPNADQSQTNSTQTSTPAIDKTKITISVLNGNGISGSAGIVKNQLVAAGFVVDKVANAYKFNYQNTIIYFKTGKEAEAELIKTTLSDRQCETNNNDAVAGNYDIVIVVGKN